ncbi:MAG: hypothetical protein MJZ68_07795 [archaeon]|nr:hypothetical protein [archaeon]
MSEMNAHRFERFRKMDNRGGIEGLPMELLIIVVVATIGMAILVGWMSGIEEPDTFGGISTNMDTIEFKGDEGNANKMTLDDLSIFVYNSKGDGIEGATVMLTGCNIVRTGNDSGTVYGITNAAGMVVFEDLMIGKTVTTSAIGHINVSISSIDYGDHDTYQLTVVF